MIVNVRCTHCGNRFKEEEHVLGQTISCPSCGLWLKVEAGPVLSGTVMFARALATEQPKPEPKPDVHHEEKEPSAWRNPAVWIAILAMVAVIIFFLVAVGHRSEAPKTVLAPAEPPESEQGAPAPEEKPPPPPEPKKNQEEPKLEEQPTTVPSATATSERAPAEKPASNPDPSAKPPEEGAPATAELPKPTSPAEAPKSPEQRLTLTPFESRRDLVEKYYYFKDPTPPEIDSKGRPYWKVGQSTTFVPFPQGLDNIRAELREGGLIEVSDSFAARLVTCKLEVDGPEHRLVCVDINAVAENKYADEYKNLVLEIADPTNKCVWRCAFAQISKPAKQTLTLGYTPNGKPLQTASFTLEYPWPKAAVLERASTQGITVQPWRVNDKPNSVSFDVILENAPDILPIMTAELGKRARAEDAFNTAQQNLDKANRTTKIQAEIVQWAEKTNKDKLDKSHYVPEDAITQKQAEDKLNSMKGALPNFKRSTNEKKAALDKAKESYGKAIVQAESMISSVKQTVENAPPIRVRDPWGRLLVEVTVKFGACDPATIPEPKSR